VHPPPVPPAAPAEAPAASPPPAPGMTVGDAARFFLPLILMTEMLFISHSVIHAFLARLKAPRTTLAGYNAAFSVQGTTGSPVWSGIPVALAFVSDRRSVYRLWVFFMVVSLPVLALLTLACLPVTGDLVYHTWLGASAEAARQARVATIYLLLIVPVVVVRNMTSAVVMVHRRTFLITLGTAVRLSALAGALLVLPYVLEGAAVGTAALLACIVAETGFMVGVGLPLFLALPPVRGEPARYRDMWRFAWPLMLTQVAEQGVTLTVNLFLGRLANPDLALAAFGVVFGLVKLFLSPVRNLAQTAQTLARSAADRRVMLRFTWRVGAGFLVLVGVLFFTPVRPWLLRSVIGLTEELAAYVGPALQVTLAMVLFWAYAEVFRGLLAGVRRTGPIAAAAGFRLAVITAVASTTLLSPTLNGAVVGVAAMSAGYAAEALVLGMRLFARPTGAAPGAGAGDGGSRTR